MLAKSYSHAPPSQMDCCCVSPRWCIGRGQKIEDLCYTFSCASYCKNNCFFFVSRWHRCTMVAICKAKKVSQRNSYPWTASGSWRQSSGPPHLCHFSYSVHSEYRPWCIFQVYVLIYRSLMKQKLMLSHCMPNHDPDWMKSLPHSVWHTQKASEGSPKWWVLFHVTFYSVLPAFWEGIFT